MFVVEDYEQKQWAHSAGTIFSCLFSGSSAGRRSADRWGLSFLLIWDLLESCFRSVQLSVSQCVWQKRSPRLLSAGLLWTVRSAGFVFLWWILDVWDLQQVVWLARSVLTLTEEHISLFGWFHSALIEVQQGAPPLQLFTWLQVRYRQQFVLTGTDKKFNLQFLFFMWHDKLCVPYVIPKS